MAELCFVAGVAAAGVAVGVVAGVEAAKALPQLTGVFAFPTTIWVDRAGVVRRIHAGFSGPATGTHYTDLTREFTDFTLELLAAPAAQ